MLHKQVLRGTHRVLTPEETLVRCRGLFKPLGITRVANVTGLDCIGIPVVTVCRPNARSLAISQGKGLTLAAAQASGVMESIELHHAESIRSPLVLASWNELRFLRKIVDLERLPRVRHSQFHPDRPILWLESADLTNGDTMLVPFELVHTNFTVPLPTGSGCFVLSSNGLSSGNHPSEAIVHGLCEVIERDAVTLFRCLSPERQRERLVDLSTVADPDCRHLLNLYERAGVAVGVWDMTSDVGVAAFRCVVLEREANSFRIMGPIRGMGCHPNREIALLRALTEAAQGRLTFIAGTRDDIGRAQHRVVYEDARLETARRELARLGRRKFEETPSFTHPTVEEDIACLSTQLRRAQLEQILVVDLTKPEFGIPVVRVIVPGLEPHHQDVDCLPGPRARRALELRAEGDT